MSVPITRIASHWAEAHEAVAPAQSIALQTRLQLLERYGDFSIAYSTAVQPKLEYFGDEMGYIAYRKRWGITFALGDPVAPRSRQTDLLRCFQKRFADHRLFMLLKPPPSSFRASISA